MIGGNPTFTQNDPHFRIHLSSSDRVFMKKIITKLASNPSEKWYSPLSRDFFYFSTKLPLRVRERFKNYTLEFLLSVRNKQIRKRHQKAFSKYQYHETFLKFLSKPENIKKMEDIQERKKNKSHKKHTAAMNALQKVRRAQSSTNTFITAAVEAAVRSKTDKTEIPFRNNRSFDASAMKHSEGSAIAYVPFPFSICFWNFFVDNFFTGSGRPLSL